ncbi:hypothetical protein DQ04_03941010 [Trypanosoma grayi]|uniref:hypothetical protein n=1 Tax=Trypanosoma grayi TaxID=71804 RepID=UPI0004F496F2|nr:hypothetical protein DQ04_03941010 [Trypanosoma grayi]KEG10275.1 hypothetical protein DQ04_03941010 [Trypanosoma grayi]
MPDRDKAAVEEQHHVVYAGAVLIPFCVGSVALPLSLCRSFPPASATTAAAASTAAQPASASTTSRGAKQQQQQRRRRKDGSHQAETHEEVDGEDPHDYNEGISRCTHIRYSYLRDGAIAAQDLAYRRAWYIGSTSSAGGAGGLSSTAAEMEKEEGDNAAVTSASPLYALVERVVFKLPNSFPEPRRELTHPPFFVVDDTWAEHMVELEVHFRPHLGIAPFTVTHMVPLQRRADIPPQLLSSTFGQSKPAPTVILPPSDLTAASLSSSAGAVVQPRPKRRDVLRSEGHPAAAGDGDDGGNATTEGGVTGENGICITVKNLEDVFIFAERRDAIRVFHPTPRVLKYLSSVRAMPQPRLEEPPPFCAFPGQIVVPMDVHLSKMEGAGDGAHHSGVKRRRSGDDDSNTDKDSGDGIGNNNLAKISGGNLLPAWCFPFEGIVHALEPKRQDGAVDAMRAVLDALRKEQVELRESIEQRISSANANGEKLRDVIQRMRDTCALLREPERQ